MSQISPPIRILLVGAVLMLAAWFTILKPKDEAAVAPPAVPAATVSGQPASAAGRLRAKAQAGKATAEADAAGASVDGQAPAAGAPSVSAPSTTGTATAARSPVLPPLPAGALAGLPRSVRAALRDRNIIVLGVLDEAAEPWAPMPDDDRLVRNALRHVNRYGGAVAVERVALGRLSRFDGLLKGLEVTQSPTVVVIDRNRTAVALRGYVDRATINQAVADARRGGTARRIGDAYLRKVNETCSNMNTIFTRLSLPTVRGNRGAWVARLARTQRRYRRAFARIAAPGRWRSLKQRQLADLRTAQARLASAAKANDTARVSTVLATLRGQSREGSALDRRFNAVGLTACAVTRTR